ncbi:hypothetical protein LZG71_29495 [Dyadobacter sp. CY312]|nr:hypothetical protein [Dyadobacter sp. CY312]
MTVYEVSDGYVGCMWFDVAHSIYSVRESFLVGTIRLVDEA